MIMPNEKNIKQTREMTRNIKEKINLKVRYQFLYMNAYDQFCKLNFFIALKCRML